MEITTNMVVAAIASAVTALGGPRAIFSAFTRYQGWLAKHQELLAKKDRAREAAYADAMTEKDRTIDRLREELVALHEENKALSRDAANEARASTREVITAIRENCESVSSLANEVRELAAKERKGS